MHVLTVNMLNGITLGQAITDLINQMITFTEYYSYTENANERQLGLDLGQFDPINQIIPSTVIPLSGTQCILNIKLFKNLKL